MGKVIALVLALALAGYLVYRFTRPAEHDACDRVTALCGAKKADAKVCREKLAHTRKAFGEEPVNRFVQCASESQSCMEAVGCTAGGAVDTVFGDFLKGFQRAMDRK
jgi:hypothetical protein